MGTIATSVVHEYLAAFENDPPLVSRHIRERLRSSAGVFVKEAADALRDAPDTPAVAYLVNLLAGNALLAPVVLDAGFPRHQAIRLMRTALRTDPAAPLRLVQGGGYLTRAADASPDTALRVLELIGATMDPALAAGAITLFLKHDSPLVRSKAALLLGRTHRNLAWVRQKLSDPDHRIRANAVESIWGVTGKEAAELFTEAMFDTDNRVVGNACLGLYLCADPAAPAALVRMSRRSNARFRASAAWVMGEVASEAFAEELDRLREDADPEVRHAALRATVRIRRARAS